MLTYAKIAGGVVILAALAFLGWNYLHLQSKTAEQEKQIGELNVSLATVTAQAKQVNAENLKAIADLQASDARADAAEKATAEAQAQRQVVTETVIKEIHDATPANDRTCVSTPGARALLAGLRRNAPAPARDSSADASRSNAGPGVAPGAVSAPVSAGAVGGR